MSSSASQLRSARPAKRSLAVARRRDRGLVKRGLSRRSAPAVVAAAILVALTIFGVLLAQVVLAQSGFEMQRLREEVARANEEHARLVLKAAKLGSSERIERVAIDQLGMMYPEQMPEYIVANVRTAPTQRLAETEAEPALGPTDPAAALGGSAP